ncbi:hypothetical protein C8R43DRAFT_1118037 [Mycena crocata]|nr:hypothetical protein C8R43DRAFT_1118037 [Mycena crocata]
MVHIDEPAPPAPAATTYPLYDIDEIFATLTLEEKGERPSPPPPPSTLPLPPPPTTPKPSIARHQTPDATPTVYQYSSPTDSGYSTRCESRYPGRTEFCGARCPTRPKPRSVPKAAHVVYRGSDTGVFDNWEQAQRATTGVRFAIHQGYATRTQALAAFEWAHINGWVCKSDSWLPIALASSDAPHPVDLTATTAPLLPARQPEDPWYIVYAGVNPGVFPTYLESALNHLGINASRHESVKTFEEAKERFLQAQKQHEVERRLKRSL